jgi:aminoglycoside 6'-N-acetyltransferase
MPDLRGERIVLRPIETGDAPALRASLATPEVAEWWGHVPDGFPFDDYPEATRLTVLVDGEVAGMVQFEEDLDPDTRSADIDVFLDPRHQDRGLGTDAMRTVARHLLEDRGHHRLTLTTATANERAIRCYEQAGFRRVGVLEASDRDQLTGEWRDQWLMERVERPTS